MATYNGIKKIKIGDNVFNLAIDNYGVCSTAKATAAKTVSIDGITSLTTGLRIYVYFSNGNSSTSPTLNVNNLGAKEIHIQPQGGTNIAFSFSAFSDALGTENGKIVELVYDANISYWLVTDYKFQADWSVTSTTNPAYIKNKPTIPASIVTTITTTAGTHTTRTNATGAVGLTIPTKTSHLTNDSGFISTAAQIIRW